jgi:DNA-binding NarL/FixJ family response regulator
MPLRVLLADNHPLVMHSLRTILRCDPDVILVGEACDGDAAVRAASLQQVDVIVMDLFMPRLSGIEATRQVCAGNPLAKVLILSLHDEPSMVQAALNAGALGYVLKNAATRDLLPAIHAIASGRSFLSPPLQARMATASTPALSADDEPLWPKDV